MYCTTPSGTRYQTGSPSATRERQSVELIAMAGTSCSVTRPGHVLSDIGLPADRVTLQEVPAMAISSTDCRSRVAEGEPVWYLVPDGVVQYIAKHKLYRAAPAVPAPTS